MIYTKLPCGLVKCGTTINDASFFFRHGFCTRFREKYTIIITHFLEVFFKIVLILSHFHFLSYSCLVKLPSNNNISSLFPLLIFFEKKKNIPEDRQYLRYYSKFQLPIILYDNPSLKPMMACNHKPEQLHIFGRECCNTIQ